MGALGITVTSPILGTRLVLAQTQTTIAGHLHEVHGTVHATFHGGGVHIHCKPGWSMMSMLRHPDSEKTNAGDLGIILKLWRVKIEIVSKHQPETRGCST